LLWVRLSGGPAAGVHFVTYDGNGNVWILVSAGTGTETARYEYGPFGEPLRLTGAAAGSNPFRFSTKRTEDGTGLVLYEYRAYSPTLGWWLSRDPLEEQGGVHLMAFASNDPVLHIDPTGMEPRAPPHLPKPKDIRRCLIACGLSSVLLDSLKRRMAGINFCGKLKSWCTEHKGSPPSRIPEAKDWISGDVLKVTTELWMRYASCVSECLGGPGYEARGLMLGTGTMLCDKEKKEVTVLIPVLVIGVWKAGHEVFEREAYLDTLSVRCNVFTYRECCECSAY